ncbi:hypothetical protein Acy02nite_69570 [Actinoplanes cyaneus]|uniref:Uncharacterized protein n=1 Tax=Actinoplanes cyaneus TaxID=52696 RepID=A0A919IQ04_9ACTN|nr:hypothetical protein Acy02nite_69570 [Actinoplanes cyaneus]
MRLAGKLLAGPRLLRLRLTGPRLLGLTRLGLTGPRLRLTGLLTGPRLLGRLRLLPRILLLPQGLRPAGRGGERVGAGLRQAGDRCGRVALVRRLRRRGDRRGRVRVLGGRPRCRIRRLVRRPGDRLRGLRLLRRRVGDRRGRLVLRTALLRDLRVRRLPGLVG